MSAAKPGTGTRIAVKRLRKEGAQGHPNVVKLTGHCCEGNHRILVYEFMTKGSLEAHLSRGKHHHYKNWQQIVNNILEGRQIERASYTDLPYVSANMQPALQFWHITLTSLLQRLKEQEQSSNILLDSVSFSEGKTELNWSRRIKIAVESARGLEYLHNAVRPVIHRDLKSSNILLDSGFNAKLSDFGLAKLGPQGDKTHISTRTLGTPGYFAPEYIGTGHLTFKTDVHSFGVVFVGKNDF
ncbi:hypothetical protein HYC85_023321 [Camellia sinensis]|uniref:non-specific serine/threonine protein kinase n=1 Tax=Camellia sinensis TaxID=4442 RepID=A0A7J7GE90_CAMSI|nr:hypothetical protein HYC85_023321 [Camellia sinensis]